MTLSGIERDFLNRVLLQDWTSPPLFDHRLLDRLVEARYITRQSAALAFGTAWREYLPGRSEADFDAWRQDAAWHAAKYARWDRHHTGTNFLPAGLNPGVPLRSRVMSWERSFDQPVPLPDGPPARTLRDAANYIKTLSEIERDTPEWRLAIQMLIDAAEDRGPMLFAKMGIERAVNRNDKRESSLSRKDPHWGRRKLVRDR